MKVYISECCLASIYKKPSNNVCSMCRKTCKGVVYGSKAYYKTTRFQNAIKGKPPIFIEVGEDDTKE